MENNHGILVVDSKTGEIFTKTKRKIKRTGAFFMTVQSDAITIAKMRLTSMEHSILLYLQGLQDYDNTVYGLSQTKLAEDLSATDATVSASIKHLEELGLVRRDKTRGHVAFVISPMVSTRGSVKQLRG